MRPIAPAVQACTPALGGTALKNADPEHLTILARTLAARLVDGPLDPDALDAAYAELDARYAAGEAALRDEIDELPDLLGGGHVRARGPAVDSELVRGRAEDDGFGRADQCSHCRPKASRHSGRDWNGRRICPALCT